MVSVNPADVYEHLFDDDLDRLFERVDAVYMRSAGPETNSTTANAIQESSEVVETGTARAVDAAPHRPLISSWSLAPSVR
jgi:hypothetical protein